MLIIKITLIYPRFKYEHAGGLQEPLGILYIASVLKKEGHDVDFIDLTFANSLKIIKNSVLNSDLIGMSSSSALFDRAIEVLKYIKKIDKNIPLVIGGPHATTLPFDALKAGFDYAVIGEGEETIIELVNALEKNKKLNKVKGIAFKDGRKMKCNKPRPFIQNVDSIPFPARNLVDYDKYFENALDNIGMIAMRGCPYNCIFCKPMQNKLFGNKIRARSVKNIVDEIEEVQNNYGNKKIFFKDDTLTTNSLRWFEEFESEVKRRGISIDGWICQSRVNQVNFKLLRKLKEIGFDSISFGVESGSQKILNFYRKGITVDQTIKAFDMCHKLKFWIHAYIMLGAPIETRKDLELTLKLIKRIKPHSISPSITTPAPGTDLYNYAKENKILKVEDYVENDYYSTTMPMKLKYLTEKDLAEYKKKIGRFVFKRRIIRALSSYPEFKSAIKTAFYNPSKLKSFIKKV